MSPTEDTAAAGVIEEGAGLPRKHGKASTHAEARGTVQLGRLENADGRAQYYQIPARSLSPVRQVRRINAEPFRVLNRQRLSK